MNKTEWKANHQAARILYSGMFASRGSSDNAISKGIVWKAIHELGVWDAIIGKDNNMSYPIKDHKWAIGHNCRNY